MANKVDEVTIGEVSAFVLDAAPTSSPGFTAPTSSLAIFSGALYIKTSTSATDWILVADILQVRRLAFYTGF